MSTLRVAIVTGAAGTLGAAVVRRLAADGRRVALVDVAPQPPATLSHEPGERQAWFGGVDLTDLAATRAAFDDIGRRLGQYDTLVNVAGGFHWQLVADGDLEAWDRMYAINL